MSEMYSKEQLAEMKEELIRELRKIYDDDDFVRGAIVFLPSENFIPHLLYYIHNADFEIAPEDILYCITTIYDDLGLDLPSE